MQQQLFSKEYLQQQLFSKESLPENPLYQIFSQVAPQHLH